MLLTLALMNFGAADLWLETSLKPAIEAAAGESASSLDQGKIYAARGESESFQLWIKGGRKGLDKLRVDGAPPADGFPPPEIYQIAALTFASGVSGPAADPLMHPAELSLGRDQTAGFWITYRIPPDATPGIYQTSLTIHAENSRDRNVEVRVEVFGFALPELPSLPLLFHLNRGEIERVYGLPKRDLDPWKPVYNSFAPYRLSYSVWDGGGLVPITRDGRATTDSFKAHLEYVLQTTPMSAIEIAGQGRALASFPAPKPGDPQDPLQFYYFDMVAWLQERGLDSRAVAEATLVPARDRWQDARDAQFRSRLADKRVPRVLAAPPHPFFERYAEHYAIAYERYDPLLIQRMKKGVSFEQAPPHPAQIHSSEAAALSSATDLYDGSMHTAWRSAHTPGQRSPAWVEFDFEEPIALSQFTIVWESGYEVKDIDVLTAFPGNPAGSTSVDWQHSIAPGAFVQNRSVSTLRYEKSISRLRLEFRSPSTQGAIGIAEIVIGAGDYAAVEEISPIEPWLDITTGAFPSLLAETRPVVARSIPWVCWYAGFEGVYGGDLNRWPRSWNNASSGFQLGPTDSSKDFLMYPGPVSLLPSLRLMRLRDGLEDFEYLKALAAAAQDRVPDDPALAAILRPQPFGPNPTDDDLDQLGNRIEDTRIRIGRWLTENEKKP